MPSNVFVQSSDSGVGCPTGAIGSGGGGGGGGSNGRRSGSSGLGSNTSVGCGVDRTGSVWELLSTLVISSFVSTDDNSVAITSTRLVSSVGSVDDMAFMCVIPYLRPYLLTFCWKSSTSVVFCDLSFGSHLNTRLTRRQIYFLMVFQQDFLCPTRVVDMDLSADVVAERVVIPVKGGTGVPTTSVPRFPKTSVGLCCVEDI